MKRGKMCYANGGQVKDRTDDDMWPATRASFDLAAKGIAHANQIGNGRQPKRDLPFAFADTLAGMAGGAALGAAQGVSDAARAAGRKVKAAVTRKK